MKRSADAGFGWALRVRVEKSRGHDQVEWLERAVARGARDELMKRSADAGFGWALRVRVEKSRGHDQVEWLERAVARGELWAMSDLGRRLWFGWGVPFDQQRSEQLLWHCWKIGWLSFSSLSTCAWTGR